MFRILCALGLLSLIFAAARTIDPSSSDAADAPGDALKHSDRHDAEFTSRGQGTLVGSVKVDGLTIHVFDFSDGQRFTVYGTEGELLAQQVSAEDLRRSAPQLDPTNMTAEASAEAEPAGEPAPE